MHGQKVRFGFHNFRHSLASALVKMKVDPKTVQEFLRQAHVTTTLQLYAQSDMESKRDAQGRFLEQLLGEFISSRGEFSDYLGWRKIGEIV
jgi:integrase